METLRKELVKELTGSYGSALPGTYDDYQLLSGKVKGLDAVIPGLGRIKIPQIPGMKVKNTGKGLIYSPIKTHAPLDRLHGGSIKSFLSKLWRWLLGNPKILENLKKRDADLVRMISGGAMMDTSLKAAKRVGKKLSEWQKFVKSSLPKARKLLGGCSAPDAMKALSIVWKRADADPEVARDSLHEIVKDTYGPEYDMHEEDFYDE